MTNINLTILRFLCKCIHLSSIFFADNVHFLIFSSSNSSPHQCPTHWRQPICSSNVGQCWL